MALILFRTNMCDYFNLVCLPVALTLVEDVCREHLSERYMYVNHILYASGLLCLSCCVCLPAYKNTVYSRLGLEVNSIQTWQREKCIM